MNTVYTLKITLLNRTIPTPSKIKDLKNLSDFQMGKHQAYEDYQISKKFRFYPKLPFVLLNLISGNRMQEVISFINGYNHEKHRLKNK